ncbi:hypothetical protein PO909_027541 [Leuciscus waleckii]
MSIVSSVPMIFLLVGLQEIMDVKFSCPCRVGRNHALTSCIFFAPAIVALNKITVEHLKEKTAVEHLRLKKNELVENLSCRKVFVVCCIPCLVWICIFFIDGDYLACGLTDCNGYYACDNELHPRCMNWCKPTKLSPPKNETECYERTLELIWISKVSFIGFWPNFPLYCM